MVRTIAALSGALALAAGVPTHASSAQSGVGQPESLAAAVEGFVAPYVAAGNFSGVVLVARERDVLLEAGYGSADHELGVAARGEHRYFIASISKTFTAAAVLLLLERGSIDLDALVANYIGDFPHGDRITVRQLLEHRSGLPNLHFRPDYAELAVQHYDSPAEVMALVRHDELASDPGASYAYNNLNYTALAWLVEQVTGVRYEEFLRREFSDPLGLTGVGVGGAPTEVVRNLAKGYDPVGVDGFRNERYVDRSISLGASGMYATARDLWRWIDAVVLRRVLVALPDSVVFAHMGQSQQVYGHPALVATGWDGIGYSAHLIYLCDERLAVVALSNRNISGAVGEIARGIAAIVLGERPTRTALAPRRLPQDSLEELVGIYRFGADFYVPNGTLEIVARDGWLFDLSREPAAALIPLAGGGFLYRPVWAEVRFVWDDAGRVTGLSFYDRFVAVKQHPFGALAPRGADRSEVAGGPARHVWRGRIAGAFDRVVTSAGSSRASLRRTRRGDRTRVGSAIAARQSGLRGD